MYTVWNTLTAAGASGATRRMITAATAAALGLLGAILGMAGAVIAGLAWARSSLSVMFGDVPLADLLILLLGLPLVAAAVGWLLAGREPDVISRQPLADADHMMAQDSRLSQVALFPR